MCIEKALHTTVHVKKQVTSNPIPHVPMTVLDFCLLSLQMQVKLEIVTFEVAEASLLQMVPV